MAAARHCVPGRGAPGPRRRDNTRFAPAVPVQVRSASPMTAFVRGLAALMCILLAVAPAIPQDRIPPASERDRISYVIGMDVGQSLSATGPDIDLAAFERAVRNAFDGGEPLVDAKTAAEVGAALAQRAAFRKGQRIPGLAPGAEPAEVDRTKAGLVVGAEVARTLMPVRDEIELPVFVQAVRT